MIANSQAEGQPKSNPPAVVDHASHDVSTEIGRNYPHLVPYQVLDPEDAPGFEFYRYLRILLKFWRLIGIVVAIMVLLATVITFLTTPIYQATTVLQIDREQMNVVKIDDLQPADRQLSDVEFYQTQYELLSSRSLAERVVASLGLADDASFGTAPTTLSSMVSGLLHLGVGDTQARHETEAAKSMAAVLHLRKSLYIQPVRGSKLVKIAIDSPDPALAQRISNGYAEIFISDNLERRYNATSYARKFLEDHLAQLKVKLEDSEKQMVKYAEANGIINLVDNKNMITNDLAAVDAKLAEVRADRIQKELLWKQAQSTKGLGLKEILDNPNIQEDLKLKASLSAQYEQKLALFKPAYPDMLQLHNQINEIDRQIEEKAGSIKQSIYSAYVAAKNAEAEFQTQVENGKADVVDQQNKDIQYNILKREADTNRALYDGLLQRYKEIGIAGGIGTNNISVIDSAVMPQLPESPVLWRNLLIASMIGLLGGCAAALLIEYLDDTFKVPEDVEKEIGLGVLGIVPKPLDNKTVEQELRDPRSGISEAYRSLRTGLQFSTNTGLPRIMFVTSSQPGEGKTTASIQLADSLALIGLNVLLIDCDLRNPSIHRKLGIGNEAGLSNYLSDNMKPEQIVQASSQKSLSLITSGPIPPNPVELFSGPKFPSLIALANESFDVVLLDGPPVMGLADAPQISSMAQATMLVVAANETRRSTVRLALRRLRFSRANVVGVLLNKFDAREAGHTYGYGYGYGDYHYQNVEVSALLDKAP